MSTDTPAAQQRIPEKSYDDDVSTPSGSDSNFEDDPVVLHARRSVEVTGRDREILDEEEEREKLLTGESVKEASKGFFSTRYKDERHGGNLSNEEKRKSRRLRKRRRHVNGSRHDEEGELMYEMEEGGPISYSSSQASESSADLDKLDVARPPMSKKRKLALWHIVTISILALFFLLTFGAYKVSHKSRTRPHLALQSNGTSSFAPTTILVSLDGFRADFLHRGITPTLNQFIAEGVSPKHMLPSFPSVTFPNHYTLVTGLYPESHGIVGNSFWDPDLGQEFYYTDPARSMQPKWWSGGEPVWVTAEKSGVKTAIHMWPGSEAGMEFSATYLDKFNGSESLPRKTERMLGLLDLPGEQESAGLALRPQLIAAYVPVVDADGHTYGPNSTEIWSTISDVDTMLHHLFIGLEERNLTNLVNVIVVSDHGMATTSTDRCVQLDDLIDLDLVEHMDGWPLYGLRPKNPIDLRGLYDRLLVESQATGNFEVYLRDENMPERYHFSKNDRIAPLWVVPKTGWAIVHKEDFDVKKAKANGEIYHPKGLHGYDHEHPLMRAIFVARGPAFPHTPNSRLEVFQNTEVYNILCDSLGIEPKPNNGTLRLPLKPVGLHADKSTSSYDAPVDLPPNHTEPQASNDPSNDDHSITADESVVAEQETKNKEAMSKFWAYVKAKMKAAQAWANKVIEALKGGSKGDHKHAGEETPEQGEPS
ncbi:hypothetical protein N7G274_010143 [Stereocaulon virgatum]|uniref:Phosphodiest-domain-containing protein n=1 Tax=Stereocaulon virgatum TaxID=373712 RepID=A0ABR3ZU91_9LECA